MPPKRCVNRLKQIEVLGFSAAQMSNGTWKVSRDVVWGWPSRCNTSHRCPPLTGTTKHTPTDFKTPPRGSILEIEPLVMWLWLLSLFLCVVKHPWIYEFSKNSWEFIGLGIYRLIHKYYMIFVIVNVILFFTVAGI